MCLKEACGQFLFTLSLYHVIDSNTGTTSDAMTNGVHVKTIDRTGFPDDAGGAVVSETRRDRIPENAAESGLERSPD